MFYSSTDLAPFGSAFNARIRGTDLKIKITRGRALQVNAHESLAKNI